MRINMDAELQVEGDKEHRGDKDHRLVVRRLAELLGEERLRQLVELIEEVEGDTRWGDVKIVIAEGRVQRLKAEKSYE
jgi:hypothetical protein